MLVAAQADGILEQPAPIGVQRDARLREALGQRGDGGDFFLAAHDAALELEVIETIAGIGCFSQAHHRLRGQRRLVAQAQPVVALPLGRLVRQVGLAALAHIEQVAQHLHLVALLAFAQQGRHRHLQELAQQIQQRRFQRGDGVDGDAQVEGLQAAAADVAIRKGGARPVQDALVVADGLAHQQRACVLQCLADALATRHLAHAGVAGAVGEDDDVAREVGTVGARQVQQHAVMPGHRDHAHVGDAGRALDQIGRGCNGGCGGTHGSALFHARDGGSRGYRNDWNDRHRQQRNRQPVNLVAVPNFNEMNGSGTKLRCQQDFSACIRSNKREGTAQALSRWMMVKPTSTMRSATSIPAARSMMKRAARWPMPVPSMRTVVSLGCRSRENSRSPKPTTANCPGMLIPLLCASIITPSASRSELQKMASISGWRCNRSARPLRPWPSVVGATTWCRGTGPLPACMPSACACWAKAFMRRWLRSSRPPTTATWRRPIPCRQRATSRPICSCEKPTSMSIGVGVRSQVSTTGMPLASRRFLASAERMMPVSTTPSGRRPMIASSSASSREFSQPLWPSITWQPAAARVSVRVWTISWNTGPITVGTTTATSRLLLEARPPARRLGTQPVFCTASRTFCKTLGDTAEGVFRARDAVIGATPASCATSRSVMPPALLRLPRRRGSAASPSRSLRWGSGRESGDVVRFSDMRAFQHWGWQRYQQTGYRQGPQLPGAQRARRSSSTSVSTSCAAGMGRPMATPCPAHSDMNSDRPALVAAWRNSVVSAFCTGQAGNTCSKGRMRSMNSLTMPRAQRPLKLRVRRVLSSRAAASAARQAEAIPDSGQQRKAVPICAACAPSSIAAAMARPSIRPPAAITGTLTAWATCGNSAMRPMQDCSKSPRKVARCPPASAPRAQMKSAPASSQARASATVVAVPMTWISFLRNCRTTSASSSPKVKLATGGAASSRAATWSRQFSEKRCGVCAGGRPSASRSGCSKACACSSAGGVCSAGSRNRFMLKGWSVSVRRCAAVSRMADGASSAAAQEPRPPALLTAAASAGGEAPFIGPCTMGCAIPTADWNCVVCIDAPSLKYQMGQILTNSGARGSEGGQGQDLSPRQSQL
eukprot:TRINITY_DN2409_c0_g6_i1.p1 TRINITY_DN2409_c0_g6~~TRINITY_DN2409_c0_g6_i1.p1  ORF type:complete len:1114 (+),score=348.13 TRINITY_DN2409_c0_g6_i1:941-4282(+)